MEKVIAFVCDYEKADCEPFVVTYPSEELKEELKTQNISHMDFRCKNFRISGYKKKLKPFAILPSGVSEEYIKDLLMKLNRNFMDKFGHTLSDTYNDKVSSYLRVCAEIQPQSVVPNRRKNKSVTAKEIIQKIKY